MPVAQPAGRAVDRVVDVLRSRMLDGSLAPGDHVAEAELAEVLGVSRTPVREAIGRLAAEGLLDQQPNRGARVAVWTPDQLAEIFELRLQLESHAARLAALNATEPAVDELDEMAERMAAIGLPGPGQDIAELHLLNRRFHDLLVAQAHRPAVAAALATAIHAAVIRRNFDRYDDASMRRSLQHHREIVAALRARDPDWAEAVMRAHLCNARATLLAGNEPLIETEDEER